LQLLLLHHKLPF